MQYSDQAQLPLVFQNILQGIGATPLITLNKVNQATGGALFAKRESTNPGGSIKDRVAMAMVQDALEKGRITKAGIVEPTSGNTGVGLAMVCAQRSIALTLTMPESMSQERRKLLHALGAKLILTPASEGMKGAIMQAEQLAAEQGYCLLDQFSNPMCIAAHYTMTGPELLQQVGNLDVFVAGVGTGATLMGVGQYLKEHNPAIRLYAVEPEESAVLSGHKAGPHAIQGIGAGFVPTLYNSSLVDGIITVKGEEAKAMARRLAKEEGILAGISSGANVVAALAIAKQLGKDDCRIATVLPDSGERYLSTDLYS